MSQIRLHVIYDSMTGNGVEMPFEDEASARMWGEAAIKAGLVTYANIVVVEFSPEDGTYGYLLKPL